MEITVTRINGALRINPAPNYLLDYLKYSHRSFEKKHYRTVNSYETKLLYEVDGSGGIITLPGFYAQVVKKISKNCDVLKVVDLRTPLPALDLEAVSNINWAGIGSSGLRDYQYGPMSEFLAKIQDGSGVAVCVGGWGAGDKKSVP